MRVKRKVKMDGWYTRKGIKVSHYVSTIDGQLAPMALCGAREDPADRWLGMLGVTDGPQRCKRCKAIRKKKEETKMQKEGWYSRKGISIAHYVETSPQRQGGLQELLTSALCGAHETSKDPWGSTAGTRQCMRCLAVLSKRDPALPVKIDKPEVLVAQDYEIQKDERRQRQDDGWYSRKKLNVSHYIGRLNRKQLMGTALCGVSGTLEDSWSKFEAVHPLEKRHCKHCEVIIKRLEKRAAENKLKFETGEYGGFRGKNPKAFEMQIQYSQVIGETIPLTWIPVPDVKIIIDLLKHNTGSESCEVSRAVTSAVIKELYTRINEAEERISRHEEVSTTWMPEEKEE